MRETIGPNQLELLRRMAAGSGVIIPRGAKELSAARRLHSRGLAAYHRFGSARGGWMPLLSITTKGRGSLDRLAKEGRI